MLPDVAIAIPKFLPKFQGSSSSTEFQGIKELHAQLHPLHAPADSANIRKILGNMEVFPRSKWRQPVTHMRTMVLVYLPT
jgi:hypothetical protein